MNGRPLVPPVSENCRSLPDFLPLPDNQNVVQTDNEISTRENSAHGSWNVSVLIQENKLLKSQNARLILQRERYMMRVYHLMIQLDEASTQHRHQELTIQALKNQLRRERRLRSALSVDPPAVPSTQPLDNVGEYQMHFRAKRRSPIIQICLKCIPILVLIAFGYGMLALVSGLLGATGWAIALVDLGSWVGRVLLTVGLLLSAIAVFSESL